MFRRRQVIAIGRQALSLIAGDAVDVYLSQKLRQLMSDRTVASCLDNLRAALWPNGTWFAFAEQSPTPSQQSQGGRDQPAGDLGDLLMYIALHSLALTLRLAGVIQLF